MRPSPSCCALTSYWTRRNSRIRKPGISLTAMSNHRTEGEGRMIGDNRHYRNLRPKPAATRPEAYANDLLPVMRLSRFR